MSCTNLNPEQLLSGLQFALMVRGGTVRWSTMKAAPCLEGEGAVPQQRGSEFKGTQCKETLVWDILFLKTLLILKITFKNFFKSILVTCSILNFFSCVQEISMSHHDCFCSYLQCANTNLQKCHIPAEHAWIAFDILAVTWSNVQTRRVLDVL